MLRPFWCNDSTTALRTLDDWLATHGDLSQSPTPMEGRCLKNPARLRQVCQPAVQRIAVNVAKVPGCCGSLKPCFLPWLSRAFTATHLHRPALGRYQSHQSVRRGHKGQLREVVLNLVQNAIDAIDSVPVGPRTLRLKTEQDGSEKIAVTIEDSGPGIDPEKMANLFRAYFTTKASGTGLGLAICRMIIDRHGGQISVSSNPGRGTQFRVLLPCELERGT